MPIAARLFFVPMGEAQFAAAIEATTPAMMTALLLSVAAGALTGVLASYYLNNSRYSVEVSALATYLRREPGDDLLFLTSIAIFLAANAVIIGLAESARRADHAADRVVELQPGADLAQLLAGLLRAGCSLASGASAPIASTARASFRWTTGSSPSSRLSSSTS